MRLGLYSFFRLPPDDRDAINDWLTEHGIDPCVCVAVCLEGEGPVAAECYELTDGGRRHKIVNGELVTVEQRFLARSLPDHRIMADWFRHERDMAVSA